MGLSQSRIVLIFGFCFLIGLVLGSKFDVETRILVLLLIVWLALWLSGQKEALHNVATGSVGLLGGWLIFHLTQGEAWLHLSALGWLSNQSVIIRDRLVETIIAGLPSPHGELLSGIIFGNKVKLDKGLLDGFKIIGLTHIVTVSGYNLTIIVQNIETIFRGVSRKVSLYGSVGFIVFFVLMTGAPASIVRAGVMSVAMLTAKFMGRPTTGLNILVLSACLIAVFEPKMIYDIGFQLSVAATYGLIRLGPIVDRALIWTRLPEVIRGILSETLSAIIVTSPIILFYFGRFSTIAPLANLLVLPLVPILMFLGIVSVIIAVALPQIANLILQTSWPILDWIVLVNKKLSALSWASFNTEGGIYTIILLVFVFVAVEILNGFEPIYKWSRRMKAILVTNA